MSAYNEFCEKNFPQDPVDMKTGRFVEPDKSVRPTRDTGFRAKPSVPFVYNPPVRQGNLVALPGYIHADDIKDLGPAFIRGEKANAVRLISVNVTSHNAREAKYLDESITARRKRDQKARA
jgi:hypothetical protein